MTMMDNDKIDPRLADLLDELRPVPARDLQVAARTRAKFMFQVDSLPRPKHRATIDGLFSAFKRKGLAMNTAFALLLVMAILLTGAITTVYAAQDDLPTEMLYPIKLETENVKLWLNPNPQARIDLLINMSQTRINEMLSLNDMNIAIPEITSNRLEQHIQNALQIAANFDNADMQLELSRIQSVLQAEEQLILHAQVSNNTSQTMARTQEMLQTRLSLVENGLTDPNGFRNSIRNEGQKQPQPTPTNSATQPVPSSTPSAGNGYGSTPQSTPGGNNYQNQGTAQPKTPTPGQGGGGNGGGGTPPSTPRNGNDGGGKGTGQPGGGQGEGQGGNKP
jgi:hypothetical protein